MKKLLLSLMVLATVISCGKDNKVSSTPVAAVGINGFSNPYLGNNPYAQTLNAAIANPAASFGQGQVYDYSSGQTCKTYGIFQYCYTTNSGGGNVLGTWNSILASNPGLNFMYSDGTTVRNDQIAVVNKQNELISLLNQATNIQYQQVQGGMVYYLTVANGYYVIDTRYALQMNPSATAIQGQGRYFLRAF